MNILITGASGFLGSILSKALSPNNNIVSLGRARDNSINCDLAKEVPKLDQKFDIVIHAAGKAHVVPKTKEEEQEFYDINLKGTEHLLSAFNDSNLPRAFVFISTVAVYGVENGSDIDESFPLKGDTPYAKSKIEAERIVTDWGRGKGVPVLILRLPLIAGPKPPGNLGKMISGMKRKRYVSIASGKARRSVVLAEDVAGLILQNFSREGIFNLTDGYHPSFRELETVISKQLSVPMPISISTSIAKLLGKIGDMLSLSQVNSGTISKMSNDLTFNDARARKELGWQPRRVTASFVVE